MGKIPFVDVSRTVLSYPADDKLYYIKESEARHDIRSLLEKSLLEKKKDRREESVNVNDQACTRRQKKERQKCRKLGQKMAADRRQSEIFLSDIDAGGSLPSSPTGTRISLYRCPLTTIEYFLREILCLLGDVKER